MTFQSGASNPRFSVLFLPTIWIFMEGENDEIKFRQFGYPHFYRPTASIDLHLNLTFLHGAHSKCFSPLLSEFAVVFIFILNVLSWLWPLSLWRVFFKSLWQSVIFRMVLARDLLITYRVFINGQIIAWHAHHSRMWKVNKSENMFFFLIGKSIIIPLKLLSW